MAGLLNSSPNQQGAPQQELPAGEQQQLDDPILKQIESNIDQQVPPEYKQMYESIVLAGMHVMFSKDTSDLIEQQLQSSNDPVEAVSDGIAKLIMIVFNNAKQDPNQFIPAAGLASITLMAHALDYTEQTGRVKVTDQLAADATKATTQKVLQGFGITPDKVNQVVAAGQQQGGAQPGAEAAPAAPPPQQAGV